MAPWRETKRESSPANQRGNPQIKDQWTTLKLTYFSLQRGNKREKHPFEYES